MSGYVIDELINWLKSQIQTDTAFGDESRAAEEALGDSYPRTVSTGHYQRAVAYRKCLQKIRHLAQESHRTGDDSDAAAKETP